MTRTPRNQRRQHQQNQTPVQQQRTPVQNNRSTNTNTMLTNANTETAIRVLLFSGKQRDWIQWEDKFLAQAKRKQMKEYYLEKPEDITPAIQATITADEAKIMEQNENAYADLIMSMDTSTQTGKIAFALVRGSKNKDYPDGNAAASWH
jgi:hypothetical protein